MSVSRLSPRVLVAFLAVASLHGDTKKLSQDQRVELVRGLSAEYATAKIMLPQSRKALPFEEDGTWDKKIWEDAVRKEGPAARAGDMVQVTKVDVSDDAITLQLNDGLTRKGSWRDRVQISMGGVTPGQNNPQNANKPRTGTAIVLKFKDKIGDVTSAQVKKMLAPVLDFDKHSSAEQYVETLPPETQQAIKEKKAIEGMDQEAVILALGKPLRKSRETKDDVEQETWQFGEPPGRVTFVTFAGPKVIRVRDTYANMGGSVAQIPTPDR
ncbi:MAG TPA: hypothetical protein VGJ09_14740 [Bryobacteraceae bacterium]|jgi:hypothetical protein